MESQQEYQNFFGEVKNRIRTAQYEALKAVNKELVGLYWDLGKMIVHKQKEHGWGKSVVEKLAFDLQREFPGQIGFSARNLWLMVGYYTEYKDDEILQPMAAEISFTHNIMIQSKCHSRAERQFYITATKKYGWTKRVLEHQIENKICRDVYKRLYSTRPTSTRQSPENTGIRETWPLRIIIPSIFWNYRRSTMNGSWKMHC